MEGICYDGPDSAICQKLKASFPFFIFIKNPTKKEATSSVDKSLWLFQMHAEFAVTDRIKNDLSLNSILTFEEFLSSLVVQPTITYSPSPVLIYWRFHLLYKLTTFNLSFREGCEEKSPKYVSFHCSLILKFMFWGPRVDRNSF